MPRYILIDDHTGFVWGEAWADTPALACRLVDEALGVDDNAYVEIGHAAPFDGRDGYHVYAAPEEFRRVEDGQDEGAIARVMALPLVARVVTRDLSPNEQRERDAEAASAMVGEAER